MDPTHLVDRRRQELDVNDEEGLLQLQAQFLAGQSASQPAARATRVTRKQPPQQQQQQQQQHPATPCEAEQQPRPSPKASQQQQQREPLEEDAPMCPAIPGILSDVKERVFTSADAPGPPAAAAGAGAGAFPKAVHRKQSKFALGRRKQQPAGDTAQPEAAVAAVPPTAAPSPPTTAPAAAATAASPEGGTGGQPVSVEAAGIERANLQRLAEMSPAEIQEAQAEISQRFNPAVLDRLRQRAANKQQQQQQQVGTDKEGQQASQGAAARAAAGGAATAAARQPSATKSSSTGTAAGFRKGFLGPKPSSAAAAAADGARPPAAAAAATTAAESSSTGGLQKGFLGKAAAPSKQRQQQQQVVASGPAQSTAASGAAAAGKGQAAAAASPASKPPATATATATAAAAAAPASGPLPPAARLRFSIHGQVLELSGPETQPPNPEEVLMRDSISRAAGAVPEGYTLPDIRVLVRSRHGPHRAVGFRMLAAVLRRAQPLVCHVGPGGQLQPQQVLLDVLPPQNQQQQQQQQQPQQQQQQQDAVGAETGVHWPDVWQYAVVALRAVMLCRLGLDEDNVQVLSAAADVLRVLLGRSSSELLLEEAGAAGSGLGWPMSWRGQLQRLDAAGPWDSVEALVQAAQQDDAAAALAAAGSSAAGDASASLPDTPEDLAAVDPLAGFLAADPLPRIRFLLQQHKANTELVTSLLAVLEAAAAASTATAEAVVRTKGLPAALMALLDLGPLGSSSGSSGGGCGSSAAAVGPGAAAACRVPVLRLLRLLCAASGLNTQLLRTAGLETAVQLLLCISSDTSDAAAAAAGAGAAAAVAAQGQVGSSSGSSGDAAAAAVGMLLQKLEVLRIWRVAAAQGVHLCHVDVMFPYLAAMLQPPAAAAGTSAGSSGQELALQWQLSCEAFQLLEVLLRHALRVSAGVDKTLGREMITPGCATAVAAAAAADWLQAAVVAAVARSLVSLTDAQLPYPLATHCSTSTSSSSSTGPGYGGEESAAEAAALQRVVSSLHPSLLLPAAVPVLCAFAAVLQYLAAYWGTLQPVPKHLAGELHQQLAAVGLWGADAAAAAAAAGGPGMQQSAAAATAAAGSLEDSRQALAAELLSSATATQQQQQERVGRALLQYCLSLLQAAGPAAAAPAACSAHVHVQGSQNMNTPLAVHAMAAGAAALLLGGCELQQQLQQHWPPTQQQQQQGQEAGAASAADGAAAGCLSSRVLSVVSANTLMWLQSAGRALVLEPWRLAQYTLQQYQLRLLLRLAPTVLSQNSLGQQQQQWLVWQVTDALLAVLPLSAPGQEAQALHALQLLFDRQQQQQQWAVAGVPSGLLSAAIAATQQLQQEGGALAALAAGVRADSLPSSTHQAAAGAGVAAVTAAAVTYPAPTLLKSDSSTTAAAAAAAGSGGGGRAAAAAGVDDAVWSKVLLQGYAVTWLSVIADTAQQQQQQQQHGSAASILPQPPPLLLPLVQAYVAENEGSRLPAPAEWLLSEIHAVPLAHFNTTGSSGGSSSAYSSSRPPMHPAAAALLLALGLQQHGSSSYMSCIAPGRQLEALLRLLYCFDVWELLPAATTQQQQQQMEPAWQDGSARWAAAVLSEGCCKQVVCGGAAASGHHHQQQQQQQQQLDVHPCQVRTLLEGTAASGSPSASKLSSQQQQQQLQQRLLLLPTWSAAPAASQLVDRLVVDLSELSFGDPLFGAHVALLLLPAAGSRLQRACWAALMDHRALHLLPPPWRCIGGCRAYLGVDLTPGQGAAAAAVAAVEQTTTTAAGGSGSGGSGSSGSSSGWPFAGQQFDAQLVGDMAKALAQGDLRKALQMQGLAGLLALHGIAAVALDQRRWRDRAVAAGAVGVTGGGGNGGGEGGQQVRMGEGESRHKEGEGSGGRGGGRMSGSGGPVPVATEAAVAVNVLRGVVRACPVETLTLLLGAGRARGLGEQDMARALVQAAHGDAGLMEKVRRLVGSG